MKLDNIEAYLLPLCVCVGTDVNAADARGVTPLHLALSRLKILGEKEKRGGRQSSAGTLEHMIHLRRKEEITQVYNECLKIHSNKYI